MQSEEASVLHILLAARKIVRVTTGMTEAGFLADDVAQKLGPKAKVVTLMADSGLKYLSTDVYKGR